MKLSERQSKLLEFVTEWHGDQKRKYTNEPYVNHVVSVAEIADTHITDKSLLAVEIGLCHDLFEDTDVTDFEFMKSLRECGYGALERSHIMKCVDNLTDAYTKELYPDLNRKERKAMEAKRLATINPISQSVKYADLIDNTSSIVRYDPEFAKTYLEEKRQILDQMRGGDINLLIECCNVLHEANISLNQPVA